MSSATVNANSNNMSPMHSDPEKGAAMETQVKKVGPLYHARRGILVFLKYFSLVFITFCILLPLVRVDGREDGCGIQDRQRDGHAAQLVQLQQLR